MSKFSLIRLIIVMASIARIVYSVPLSSFIQEHSYGKKMDVIFKTIHSVPTSTTNVTTRQPTNASPLMEFKDVRKRIDLNFFRSIYDNATKHSIDDIVPQHTQTPTNPLPNEENKRIQRDTIPFSFIATVIVIMLLFILVVTSLARGSPSHT